MHDSRFETKANELSMKPDVLLNKDFLDDLKRLIPKTLEKVLEYLTQNE